MKVGSGYVDTTMTNDELIAYQAKRIARLETLLELAEGALAYEKKQRQPLYRTPKSPEQLNSVNKPFPAIGQLWRFDGDDTAPPDQTTHAIVGLRWHYGCAEAVFDDNLTVAGVEHMMENNAWKCVGVVSPMVYG